MKKRIWEVDALRGFCIICMLFVHLYYDLSLFGLFRIDCPWLITFFFGGWGGGVFFLISGISANLGSRSVRRGLMVLGCALVISAVTVGMELLGFSGMSIYFGVLHCLGVCMLLWPVFRKLPGWSLGLLGLGLVLLGLWLKELPRLDHSWLMALGLRGPAPTGSDYFPLFPNLGFFLLGAGLGKLLYAKKESLLPRVSTANPLVRFFCWFGKHSLPVYMLHQPILFGCVWLIANCL